MYRTDARYTKNERIPQSNKTYRIGTPGWWERMFKIFLPSPPPRGATGRGSTGRRNSPHPPSRGPGGEGAGAGGAVRDAAGELLLPGMGQLGPPVVVRRPDGLPGAGPRWGGGNTDIHRACECGGEDPFITRHLLTQGYPWNPMPPTSGMERSQRKRVNNLHEGNSPLSCGGGVVGSPSRNPCLSLRGPAGALRGSGVEDCGDDGRRHRGPRARHLAPS